MNLDVLRPLISDRAYQLLLAHGAPLEDLTVMDAQQLADEVRGVGPVLGAEIAAAIARLNTDTTAPEPQSLAPNYQPALEEALMLLTEIGRPIDVANLKIRLQSEPPAPVVETAIAIFEGLPGGNLGANLAAQVRAKLP